MNEIIMQQVESTNGLIVQQTSLTQEVGTITPTSWTAPTNMTYEQYEAVGKAFQQIKQSLGFWLGDWLLAGEERFEDIYTQAVEDTGKQAETLLKYRAVAARIPKEIRQPSLTWTHAFYCSYVLVEHRGPLLVLAANVGLSSRELKEVVKLDDDRRQALLEAYENYVEEQGPMEYIVFMRLLNRYKLDSLDDPVESDEDDDDSDDASEDEESDARPDALGVFDDVMDWWENMEVPIVAITHNYAVWQGMAVTATLDKKGKAILVWQTKEDE